MISKSRRTFLSAFACLPFLGFLKPESKKSNTFRDLYAFLKKYKGCLRYDEENDCFVIERFHNEVKPFHCSFKGAEKDERSDGENYTRPALISLSKPVFSFNVARDGKATRVTNANI